MIETRHNLVKYHGYSISDLEEMTPVEIDLTVLMIVSENEKNKD